MKYLIIIFFVFILSVFDGNLEAKSLLGKINEAKMMLLEPGLAKNEILIVAEDKGGKMTIVSVPVNARAFSKPISSFRAKIHSNGDKWISISGSRGYTILAVRAKLNFETKSKVESGEIIFVPYSKKLDTSEIRQVGMNILKYQLAEAKKELRELKVKSRAFPKRLVADVIDEKIILALIFVEHTGCKWMTNGKHNEMIGRVLLNIGLNGTIAFHYSNSVAGAKGIGQFMESTYLAIIDEYPEAKLIYNFYHGMQNHVNVMKAQFLLADHNLSLLPEKTRIVLLKSPMTLGKYLAAAYFAGGGYAKKILLKYGGRSQAHDSVQKYLAKFQVAYSYLKAEILVGK